VLLERYGAAVEADLAASFLAVCSKLYGCTGELYRQVNSTGSQRLLDWSYAGYMAGEMPIPQLPVVASVMVSHVA